MKLTIDTSELEKLRYNMQKSILKKALRAGTKEVVAAVRNLVHVDTGALKKSIKSKVDNKQGSATVYGVVGASRKFQKLKRKPSRYLHLQKPDPLALAWGSKGERYVETVKAVIGRELKAR